MIRRNKLFFLLAVLFFQGALLFAETPEHYYNDPKNLHPDPNYTPGNFPLADVYPARVTFEAQKAELASPDALSDAGRLYTLGAGEITYSSVKNESAEVLGYFRNYFGVVTMGPEAPERMEIVIDVNSMDTGVPGRNHRILNVFFESMKPELGTIRAVFDRFDLNGKTKDHWKEGYTITIRAAGSLTLNGVTRDISLPLNITRQGPTWIAETVNPLTVLISDFAFGGRVDALLKSCNHQALGNKVEVNAKLYFR